MFNLIKKDKDKKEKKEKKEKREKMSIAELKNLEEVGLRRGLFNLNRSSKRESKSKLEISAPIPIKVASSSDLNLTDIDSDTVSNRGSMIFDSEQLSTASSSDDLKIDESSLKGSVLQRAALFGSLAKQNSVQLVKRFSFSQKSREEMSEVSTPSESSATPSPQVEMRNEGLLLEYLEEMPKNMSDTLSMASPNSLIPEIVSKSFAADLRLPLVVPPIPTEPRELVLQRRNTGDFGFSLRRTTMLDRGPDGQVYRRMVHFAEPGAGTKDLALGLMPGDRLVEINNKNVENRSRDEIVEMIRQSGDTVRLKVQPILELNELSRSWLRNHKGIRRDTFGSEKGENDKAMKVRTEEICSPQLEINGENVCATGRFENELPAQEEVKQNMNVTNREEMAHENEAFPKKKVVKIVRKVIRKALPGESGSDKAKTMEVKSKEQAVKKKMECKTILESEAGSRTEISKTTVLKIEKNVPSTAKIQPAIPTKETTKDDISVGLTSLMTRGKTKDHKPRLKLSEKKEDVSTSDPNKMSTMLHLPALEQAEKQNDLQMPEPVKSEAQWMPQQMTHTDEAQLRLERIFTTSLEPAVPPTQSLVPSQDSSTRSNDLAQAGVWAGVCARVSCWTNQVEEVSTTVLQSSASAQPQLKTEEQIAAEQAWYEADKVWLVHKDGFSLAAYLKTDGGTSNLPEGNVKIILDHDRTILEADEDDVEKANPPTYDRVEDLASLLYLNESSVLHTIRQRYGGNLIHTYAGSNMIVVNPLSSPSMYSEKVMHMFKGCRREDMSPHVYAVAQTAYRNLLTTRQDQSIVLLGRSGSGKTTNSQHLVHYLVTIAGSTGKVVTVEKWQAVYSVLEAFGNSTTSMNSNATRFSQIISLDFDQAGQVASASIQTMLLEKLRVSKRPENEGAFNVFYYLMAGAESTLRTELHLNHFAENNAFGIVPLLKPEEKQKAAQQFNKLQAAMKVLGISVDEQKAFWHILGAIYHLGAAGATKAGRRQFARHEWGQKAAYLLGCNLEELSSALFKHQPKGALQRSTSFRQGPDECGQGDGSGLKITAIECLEGMASSLYGELFTLLISLINRALKSTQNSVCSVMIVDTPGFQNPKNTSQDRAATYEELCHNYAQERLQMLFYERTFLKELDRYKEENLELELDDVESSSSISVAAIDQASHQTLVRTLARTDEARGLFWLLDEEALQPDGNEDTLLERLFTYYGQHDGDKNGQSPLLKSNKAHHFILGHYYNTNWVEYDTTGWLNHAKQNPASQNAAFLLQDSQKKIISNLFMGRAGTVTVLSGSIAGLEGGSQLTLRRATSMRKTFTTGVAAVKKKSSCIQIKLQVDALIDTIKKSKIHFIHCLLPKTNVFTETKVSPTPSFKSGITETDIPAENFEAGLMQLDVPLLRVQIRGCKLLDALRIYRQGYPDHMVFSEFRRRFDVLAPHLTKKHGRNYIVKDEKRAVEELLESLDLEKSSYHIGLSRVFFRAGALIKLEEQRDEQTRRNITLFQAACRGYLARQYFKKRKVQELAIRCVQKNIKKNKGVKNWPWWKLFTTVRPLIEVQLTEEQLRGKDEEIQQLRSKIERVEKERNELRLTSDRLESRLGDLTSELTDERNTGESATQLLETETAERLRLEKEMKELQAKYDGMKKQMESMEMEVMEARLIKAAELNGDLDDDESGGEWRLKYERAIREIDFTKKRMHQEFDDKLEVELQNKRQLERKVADLQADNEEMQRSVQQLKKKSQRLTAELQDTKLHLEGQQGRNHELEKKQRKFDSELSQAADEAQREKIQKEKLSRERDGFIAEIFSLKQQLDDKDSEIITITQKAERLDAELQDLSSQESKDEASLAKVKKQVRELEAKVKDQEEELDEQAGTIQMLEQAKLRLEMEMERHRQTQAKEIESKEEEVEEIRQSCQKKLKQFELQLEEEYDEKQKILREKRDLENKLSTVSEQVSERDFETEKRLRKDLRRTKALLADAQIMLDHLKNNAPSKREIAQLKNQLEESEFTCAVAVKARKAMEVEMEDLHLQIEDISKAKVSLEEQLSRLQREKNELQSRLEEDQEDMNELMKKHKAIVSQSSRDLAQINELQSQLEEANKEKQELQEKLQGLQSQLEFTEQSMVDKSLVSRQEAKIRELETKLEFEKTQVKRLETLVSRLKENLEKLGEERDQRAAAENREKEQNKRLQRQHRDLKEELGEVSKKEAEASRKKHELEMDIESLEAANQSLQSDLKLAFKRIGDLQAAIEDEMESDENEDLINSEGDSDTDSEVDERVDDVKSWLSKNKGSAKTYSDDGSLKSSRFSLSLDLKEGKEGKDLKEGKEVEDVRPVSVMSSLSYRKRGNMKDSLSGKSSNDPLLTALSKERSTSPDRSFRRIKKTTSTDNLNDNVSVTSWKKSQGVEDLDDRGSVISQAYSEATSRARKGLDRRWAMTSPDFDKVSAVSVPVSRISTWRGLEAEDDIKSSVSFAINSPSSSLRRSLSRLDDNQTDLFSPVSPLLNRKSEVGVQSPTLSGRTDSRLSFTRSRFGEMNDDDDAVSVVQSERSSYSQQSVGRSYSVPARPRSSASDDMQLDSSNIKPVSHRNYLDPDLEAAINEVLNYKPITFKRTSLDPDTEEDEEKVSKQPSIPLRSSSSLDFSKPQSKKSKKSRSLDSESSASESEQRKKVSKKHSKKSKKKSKKKESDSESSESSSSSSSSGSTVSYRSINSIKRGAKKRESNSEDELDKESKAEKSGKKTKKSSKNKMKQVDSVMMKYLYRPESDE
ncbi:unconventional myosin-XVIIIa isoform X4 [Chiloscyllium punctatum]|uniref:unconventional myosin-XVIIIa isoform X4 n=1 Tax=Chiloscyllium punctatum TaxID=137246 RepID=UPI003B63FE24